MRDRALWGHALVAALCSLLALMAWQQARWRRQGETVIEVIAPDAGTLSSVVWQSDELEITLQRSAVDINVTLKKGRTTAQPGEPAKEPTIAVYPGSPEAAALLTRLHPLRALRLLSRATAEQLDSFGLHPPRARLLLNFSGASQRVVDVGTNTYGSRDIYARLDDGTLFLLAAKTLEALQDGGAALLDKSLIGFLPEQIERVRVQRKGRQRLFVYRYSDSPAKAFFADPAEPNTRLPRASVWFSRLLRLSASDIPTAASHLTDKRTPEFSVEFLGAKGSLGKISVWSPDNQTARVTTTRFAATATVTRNSVLPLLQEVDDLLAQGR